jgi:TPR repeat protein
MMKLRLFALATLAAASAFATPAAAQSVSIGHIAGPPVYGGPALPDTGLSSCRGRAFQCGVTAFNFYGVRQSLAWFQRGARQGSVPSMRSIGLILIRGEGNVPADPAAAMGWFYEAALRGDALSMRALADGFEQGVGVARDPALASYWRERAAGARNAQAPRFLRPTH